MAASRDKGVGHKGRERQRWGIERNMRCKEGIERSPILVTALIQLMGVARILGCMCALALLGAFLIIGFPTLEITFSFSM